VGSENLSSMVSANRDVASDWMEGNMVVSVARQGHSVIEGILTCDSET
jgi:hypothetical protein